MHEGKVSPWRNIKDFRYYQRLKEDNFDDTNFAYHETSLDSSEIDKRYSNEEAELSCFSFSSIISDNKTKQNFCLSVRKYLDGSCRLTDKEFKLTEKQRESLYLYFIMGKTECEVGEITQLHQTTVSAHIRFGLKKIMRMLKEDFPNNKIWKKVEISDPKLRHRKSKKDK